MSSIEYWITERDGGGFENLPVAVFSNKYKASNWCQKEYDDWEFQSNAVVGEYYDAIISKVKIHR